MGYGVLYLARMSSSLSEEIRRPGAFTINPMSFCINEKHHLAMHHCKGKVVGEQLYHVNISFENIFVLVNVYRSLGGNLSFCNISRIST
jgi:hypothetical protein